MIEKPSLLVKRREKREREKNCVIKITHTHTHTHTLVLRNFKNELNTQKEPTRVLNRLLRNTHAHKHVTKRIRLRTTPD